jgi:hypothetical protein
MVRGLSRWNRRLTTGLTGGTCTKGAGDHWREVTHTVDALGRETAATQTDASDDIGNGDQVSAATYDAQGSVLDRSSSVAGTQTRTGSTFTLNILGQVITEEHYHTVSGTRTADATAKTTFDAVGNPVDACFWKAGIATDVCRTAGNPPPNPPTTVTSTTYDARNNPIAQTTLATDGSTTLGGTTVYNPDADYQPAAVARWPPSSRPPTPTRPPEPCAGPAWSGSPPGPASPLRPTI